MWYSNSLIGSSSPLGGTGTASVSYGPVDHSIPTQSGTPGLKTDGTAGYVDLRTAYDYLNGLALDKFAIVSVVNTPTGNANLDRVISAETGDGAGFRWNLTASADELIQQWSGTGPKSTTLAPTDDTLHAIVDVFDIANTNGYGAVDTDAVVTDATTSALAACNVSKVVLSKLASGAANIATANYGFTAILNLSGVTTVDATFTANLAAAIAGVTTFDPALIAKAIYALNNNIDGVYFALTEGEVGSDASGKYLLAYDITDQSAKTSDFYGLVSTSGVEGVELYSSDTVIRWANVTGGSNSEIMSIDIPNYSNLKPYKIQVDVDMASFPSGGNISLRLGKREIGTIEDGETGLLTFDDVFGADGNTLLEFITENLSAGEEFLMFETIICEKERYPIDNPYKESSSSSTSSSSSMSSSSSESSSSSSESSSSSSESSDSSSSSSHSSWECHNLLSVDDENFDDPPGGWTYEAPWENDTEGPNYAGFESNNSDGDSLYITVPGYSDSKYYTIIIDIHRNDLDEGGEIRIKLGDQTVEIIDEDTGSGIKTFSDLQGDNDDNYLRFETDNVDADEKFWIESVIICEQPAP